METPTILPAYTNATKSVLVSIVVNQILYFGFKIVRHRSQGH